MECSAPASSVPRARKRCIGRVSGVGNRASIERSALFAHFRRSDASAGERELLEKRVSIFSSRPSVDAIVGSAGKIAEEGREGRVAEAFSNARLDVVLDVDVLWVGSSASGPTRCTEFVVLPTLGEFS